MLQIYNTLTRKKEVFKPIHEGEVRMYVCGMTVYDLCHIGHARVLVSFDVVTRYLRAKGYKVTYVRNITDVDDKIIKRANENGETFTALTERMIAEMHKDSGELGVLPPDAEPKATAYIAEMQDMISTLIEKGYAYAPGNGDVYYRVHKFDGYGKLSGKILEELQAGARIGVDEMKEDPLDFVLWKGAKEGEPYWESPWGNGRPGWHIECSAMGKCCLGETFDIHGGGPDLKFPHHENEIAQSEAANGKTFVNTWMHAGAVRVDNEKMSKSLGNFFTIREVLEKYPAEVVRYFLISSQYRSPINYSEDSLKEAGVRLERLYTALEGLNLDGVEPERGTSYEERFHAAMEDDFNTPEALGVLFELVRHLNKARKDGEANAAALGALVKELGGLLGILQDNPDAFLKSGGDVDEAWILEMIEKRKAAKAAKDFAEADRVREELAAQGVQLKDTREGTTWQIER
ncbi:cysteine--tRNA ligase [Parendozoicomonas haliclonae]|uniref:Cysteine--tRNA ligase n=1 Tax=Parendozoicomonas haliclonae TaxID=1960125 RepID=A0A1X7AMC7_9GAMM|nr:cysteine--tRNA ligase [Parendozoicomonas haliclonae]SMA49034.1 Cysteine-tRNA ligase [Parendozoicomonas haliclonae]